MARERKRRDRSEEVYAAALKLFREKGYHATSMQDIAAAVGLYKGSLYHYIDGKEDLLARVFERAMGALLADVERIAADTTARPSAQLRQIIGAHVEAVANNLDALTVFLHEWRALAGESLTQRARAARPLHVARRGHRRPRRARGRIPCLRRAHRDPGIDRHVQLAVPVVSAEWPANHRRDRRALRRPGAGRA